VAEAYHDSAGRSRDDVVRLAADYAARHQPLHLLSVERHLAPAASGGLEAELLVAAAAVPVESLLDASRASADVAVVTLLFVEEAPRTWRVASADWRPATAGDLLPRR
jgi:hypothetical protein